ncbi:fumarylacetoacetate hydrolase family protein [Falsirhodobacter halotolerans]|uniref:fumarylacetoacetate hydrolase family protein n=1 Tax=Falsirhodobacter halotolerans TaxID=1146892 RepID=UPI001FD092F4|nr:fumarylacetoacetate hydrolase family protein [Falsirhodobacter halotolerans]MCJ8138372.1 fumarylacetoacetate hydrolase family protein [Falsirhodobacter halotolerans]
MTDTLFPQKTYPTLPVKGETAAYPVHRIFCVGQNYADHAKEVGSSVDTEAPFFFLKDASALVPSGTDVAYALGTENLHYEIELVLALGQPLFNASEEEAARAIYGYAVGLDMTRRDLQAVAKKKGRPWDFAKNFEESAIIAPLTRAGDMDALGDQRIWLTLDGDVRQDGKLSDMARGPAEVLSYLSRFYRLQPGDLVMTGTPAGIGAVVAGSKVEGGVDGLDPVRVTFTD